MYKEQFAIRTFLPDRYTDERYRAFQIQSAKRQVVEQLVETLWVSPKYGTHPYCIEIVQEWRNIQEYLPPIYEPGQEMTLRVFMTPVRVQNIILPNYLEENFTFQRKLSLTERIKNRVNNLFNRYRRAISMRK